MTTQGNTPLHAAVLGGSKEIVEFLLQNNAINAKNHSGQSPIGISDSVAVY